MKNPLLSESENNLEVTDAKVNLILSDYKLDMLKHIKLF